MIPPTLKKTENLPVSASLFQRLEALEDGQPEQAGQSRWMVPYADLLTLLLGFFLVMFAVTQHQSHQDAGRMAALKKEVAQLQHRLEEMPIAERAAFKTLSEQVRGIDGIVMTHEARGTVISLRDSLLFPAGSAELTPEARRTLDRLAGSLKDLSHPIRVEGHTDDTPIRTGRYPSNWELSTARATNILRYLADRHRIPSEMLSAAGYGQFKPVSENSSIEGKQKNRRVDIVVLNGQMARQEPPDITGNRRKP